MPCGEEESSAGRRKARQTSSRYRYSKPWFLQYKVLVSFTYRLCGFVGEGLLDCIYSFCVFFSMGEAPFWHFLVWVKYFDLFALDLKNTA